MHVTASHYSALLFPHSPGAVRDLARSTELGNIVTHFVEENSKQLNFLWFYEWYTHLWKRLYVYGL